MNIHNELHQTLMHRGLNPVTTDGYIRLLDDERVQVYGKFKASELCILADVLNTLGVGDCGVREHDNTKV